MVIRDITGTKKAKQGFFSKQVLVSLLIMITDLLLEVSSWFRSHHCSILFKDFGAMTFHLEPKKLIWMFFCQIKT